MRISVIFTIEGALFTNETDGLGNGFQNDIADIMSPE